MKNISFAFRNETTTKTMLLLKFFTYNFERITLENCYKIPIWNVRYDKIFLTKSK